MPNPDGELLDRWNQRQQQWGRILQSARAEQIRRLGRTIGPIHWIGSPETGPCTWLGFFWEPEQIWFGYGFDGREFRLLIEADAKKSAARPWKLLRLQMPEVWNYADYGRYLRLFAGIDSTGDANEQLAWLKSRSSELHEYVLESKGSGAG